MIMAKINLNQVKHLQFLKYFEISKRIITMKIKRFWIVTFGGVNLILTNLLSWKLLRSFPYLVSRLGAEIQLSWVLNDTNNNSNPITCKDKNKKARGNNFEIWLVRKIIAAIKQNIDLMKKGYNNHLKLLSDMIFYVPCEGYLFLEIMLYVSLIIIIA